MVAGAAHTAASTRKYLTLFLRTSYIIQRLHYYLLDLLLVGVRVRLLIDWIFSCVSVLVSHCFVCVGGEIQVYHHSVINK